MAEGGANIDLEWLDSLFRSADTNETVQSGGDNDPSLPTADGGAQLVSRFARFSDEEIARKIDDAVPQNTRRKEQWAVTIFNEWRNERQNSILRNESGGLLVTTPIEEWNHSEWNYLLRRFVLEVRKKDGQKYNATSLKDLFGMLQHYVSFTLKKDFSFWKGPAFAEARQALDAAMKETVRDGNIPGQRASQPISGDIEMELWERGDLGTATPKQLLFTLIFYVGKNFALRGGTELHQLQYNKDIVLSTDVNGECLVFVECTANKTNNRGLKMKRQCPREVRSYHTPGHERCLVCLYKMYDAMRPVGCPVGNLFLGYFKNLASIESGKWFQNVPLGRHTLDGIVKTLTNGSGMRLTNQSLRKTCATTLHRAGIERGDISRITGHSSSALERYIGMDSGDQLRISRALHVSETAVHVSSGGSLAAPIGKPAAASVSSELHSDGDKKRMRVVANGTDNTVTITWE